MNETNTRCPDGGVIGSEEPKLSSRETAGVVASSHGPVIHGRGDARLDAVVDFVDFAARSLALTAFLDDVPTKIASIFAGSVCSLYLLEPSLPKGIERQNGSDRPLPVEPPVSVEPPIIDVSAPPQLELVMRGNVGFPAVALGDVRLSVGEGITGMAVALERPISTADASHHQSYRHFDQLGEERFPVFLCAPILGPEGPLGAVTVQREAGRPFESRDVELMVALAASLAHNILRAELLDQLREQSTMRGPGGGTRRVTLPGRPVIAGRAVGAIAAIRRPASRPRDSVQGPDALRLFSVAFDVAAKAVSSLRKRAEGLGLGIEAQFLHTYTQILEDRRFFERAHKLIEQKKSIGAAMGEVAREVTRAARLTGESFSEQRARDIEDLCDALTMLAASDPRAELPSKAALIGDRLTVYDLLVSARHCPSAIALGDGSGTRTRALAALMGVPCVTAVQGLFKWAADGDLALIDGDHGLVVLNPSKADVQRARSAKAGG